MGRFKIKQGDGNFKKVAWKDEVDAVKTYVDEKIKTDVPANAEFTDTVTPIVDNLTSVDVDKALSAQQGKVLKDELAEHKEDYTQNVFKTKTYNEFPPNPYAFDVSRENLLLFNSNEGFSINIPDVSEDIFEGQPTIKITHNIGVPLKYYRYNLTDTINLSDSDYLDIYFKVNRETTSLDTMGLLLTDTDNKIAEWYLSTIAAHDIIYSKNGIGNFIRTRVSLRQKETEINLSQIRRIQFYVGIDPSESNIEWNIAKIDIVNVKTPIIQIDFDDSSASVYNKAFPIMSALGLKGSMFVITGDVDKPNRITWEQLEELHSNGWLIGSHTHDHTYMGDMGVTEEHKVNSIVTAQNILRNKGYIVDSLFLAYPGGQLPRSQMVRDEVWNNYVALRRVAASRHKVKEVGNDTQVNFESYNIEHTTSVDDIKSWIDLAVENKMMCRLLFHHIVDTNAAIETQYLTTDFTEIMEYITNLRNMGQVIVNTPKDLYLQYDGIVMSNIDQYFMKSTDGTKNVILELP